MTRVAAHRTAVSAMAAVAIKASGALLTLAIFTLAARAMTADEFGRLAIWFNAVSLLAIAASFGQDTLIARSFSEYAAANEYGMAWGAYRFGWSLTIVSGALFAVAILILAPVVFPKIWWCGIIPPAFYLFTQTLLHYSSHSTRVIVNFAVSELTRDVLWRVLLLVVVALAAFRRSLTMEEFFIAGGVGQLLSFLVALYYVRRSSGSYVYRRTEWADWRLWLSRSLPMWQSAILEAANLYVDVILIGYVASAGDAGQYFAAARIANVFLMVLTGLNTYTVSRSATLYFSGQTEKLQEILRSLMLVSTAMLAPLLLLIYIFGDTLLTIFGARFASDYPTLVILSTACFLMSACGSASMILLTTGQEKIYSRVIGVATVLRVSLTALLAWRFGAAGAACAWALVNVPLFMLLSAICARRIGVDPSILNLAGPLRAKFTRALGGAPTPG